MEGYIDEFGFLYIKRGKMFKNAECCYNSRDDCCDECAMFAEPTEVIVPGGKEIGYALKLCNTYIYFDKFEDRRSY